MNSASVTKKEGKREPPLEGNCGGNNTPHRDFTTN
jgi:hypothetical protein